MFFARIGSLFPVASDAMIHKKCRHGLQHRNLFCCCPASDTERWDKKQSFDAWFLILYCRKFYNQASIDTKYLMSAVRMKKKVCPIQEIEFTVLFRYSENHRLTNWSRLIHTVRCWPVQAGCDMLIELFGMVPFETKIF